MSVFKKITKIAAETAFIVPFCLSTVGPIVSAGLVPLAVYGFIREEFFLEQGNTEQGNTEQGNTVQVDEDDNEELRRQILEATRGDVQITWDYKQESKVLF